MMSRPQSMAPSAAGFTLLEMLVCLTILALVAALALPLLARPSESLRLQATARDLVGALRLTRATAIARNTEMALLLDVDKRTFESPVVPLRSFPSDIVAVLKFAAAVGADEVVPLLGISLAHASDVAVLVVEHGAARQAAQKHRRRQLR